LVGDDAIGDGDLLFGNSLGDVFGNGIWFWTLITTGACTIKIV
jgi:hypothetical protein